MEWKLDDQPHGVPSSLPLETFLSGMETGAERSPPRRRISLETFLSGMETGFRVTTEGRMGTP